MIKLKEILHRLRQESEKSLTPVDNWKITDYDFMTDMGFKPDGQCSFSLKKPHIKVYHKKGTGFVVEDHSKIKQERNPDYDHMPTEAEEDSDPVRYTFPSFTELTEYFTKYEQKFENEPYKS